MAVHPCRRMLQHVLPRVGLPGCPNPIRPFAAGLVSMLYWSLDTYGNGMGSEVSSSGSVSDQTNGITPGSGACAALGSTCLIQRLRQIGHINARGVDYTSSILPYPRFTSGNFAVQRAIRHKPGGRRLLMCKPRTHPEFPVDINQVPENNLSGNDSAYRPYTQFQSVFGSNQ